MKKSMIALTTIALLALTGCGGEQKVDYTEFAQCLTNEGMTIYGAFWCPHCSDQKELFGDAFEFVDYVECDPRDPVGDAERCLAEGIESYPTWIYTDGRRWEGTQTLETLSEVTGCTLPSATTDSEDPATDEAADAE